MLPEYGAWRLGGPRGIHWTSGQRTQLSRRQRSDAPSTVGAPAASLVPRPPRLAPTPALGTHSLPGFPHHITVPLQARLPLKLGAP